MKIVLTLIRKRATPNREFELDKTVFCQLYQIKSVIMANAESPDPSADLVPVPNKDEEVDPVAPAPEPKLPTRKDASLKEFMSKMDDYAPIVCYQMNPALNLLTLPRFLMP